MKSFEGLGVEEQIDGDTFRHVLGHFCSGVTVVTALVDDRPAGLTCQSFFSLSIDPPLVAFSPSKLSKSYAQMRGARSFCINILAEDQRRICTQFARSGSDKWIDVAWRLSPGGSPILEGALAWIDCRREVEHEAGDHYLTIGRITGLKAHSGRPLLYYRSDYAVLPALASESAAAS